MFTTPATPNLTDFLAYLAGSVQIPSAALPASSPYPNFALNLAIAQMLNPPGGIGDDGSTYSLATYNCATHILFLVTPDQPGQSYFANARGNSSSTTPPGFGLNAPSTGLIAATSDDGTSATLASPEWAKMLTIEQLDFYKTPWGRSFLAWQQTYGPAVWGLT